MKKHTPKSSPAAKSVKRPPAKAKPKAPPKLGFVGNLRAAAVRLSLRPLTVQAAKRAACPAFKQNNTIDCDALAAWLRSHPEIIELFEKLPNKEEEEAWKTQSERRIKDTHLMRTLDILVPLDQVRRLLTVFSKLFVSKLYNLPPRLLLEFGIPEEKTRAHLDPILKTLDPREIEKLVKEIARNSNR